MKPRNRAAKFESPACFLDSKAIGFQAIMALNVYRLLRRLA
jgi:hypothetical protein